MCARNWRCWLLFCYVTLFSLFGRFRQGHRDCTLLFVFCLYVVICFSSCNCRRYSGFIVVLHVILRELFFKGGPFLSDPTSSRPARIDLSTCWIHPTDSDRAILPLSTKYCMPEHHLENHTNPKIQKLD